MKCRRVFLKFLLPIMAIAALIAAGLCLFPQQVLTIDSGTVKADVLVLLGGGKASDRPERAAELFKHGDAPIIVISGFGDANANRRVLLSAGIPASAIQIEGNSKSTRENAEFSIPLLRAAKIKRAIIVTSWYHSRRSLHCFQHYAPDIKFYSRPSYYGYPREAWKPKGINRYIDSEYLKTIGYWVCYGVCPL